MRRSTGATGSRASSISSVHLDGSNFAGTDDATAGANEFQADKALSQLSLNPSPSVDDLLAAAAAAASGTKLSPKNGESKAGSTGDVPNTAVGASPEAPHSTTAATTKLRVRIKRYHAVARWTWNVAGVPVHRNTSPDDDDGSTDSASRQQRMSVEFSPDEEEEVCTICQSAFEGTAPGTKFPGDECPVVWGKCGHSFHLSCVSTWLGDKTTCPYCRAEWEFGLDRPVDQSDDDEEEEADEDAAEGNTSAERSGNTIRRRQRPTLDGSAEEAKDEEEEEDDVDDRQEGSDGDIRVEEEEEEDDFWDSDSQSYENESEEDSERLNDSENGASRSSSPFHGAASASSESSEGGSNGGTGRSYRYATP
mmetsp:Transcript_11993/g.34288  ORF Transcript_11993/g.34288 Transcript_11993/m.34288 type:complete len:365 (-) Transcript_11993:57-1151(-)